MNPFVCTVCKYGARMPDENVLTITYHCYKTNFLIKDCEVCNKLKPKNVGDLVCISCKHCVITHHKNGTLGEFSNYYCYRPRDDSDPNYPLLPIRITDLSMTECDKYIKKETKDI